MGKRAVAAVAGEMWEPAFGAGFQAPRANQESQVSYSSRPPAACHFHSKAANSAHFLRNRIFGLPDGLKSSFSRKPPKMHPSSDSCAVPEKHGFLQLATAAPRPDMTGWIWSKRLARPSPMPCAAARRALRSGA